MFDGDGRIGRRSFLVGAAATGAGLLLPRASFATAGSDRLYKGERLGVNQFLRSPNGHYELKLQSNGNLVLRSRHTQRVLWHTKTNRATAPATVFSFKPSGNLALHTAAGTIRWRSFTDGTTARVLVLRDNGNLLLYGTGTKVLWANGLFDDYPEPWRSMVPGSGSDDWGYDVRNCTSFVAWRMHGKNRLEMPRGAGNGGEWRFTFPDQTNNTPAVGAVAENLDGGGHVAWVNTLHSNGDVTVEEYNVTPGMWSIRRVPGSAFWYIHLKDF